MEQAKQSRHQMDNQNHDGKEHGHARASQLEQRHGKHSHALGHAADSEEDIG
jgi:hypothetical protein